MDDVGYGHPSPFGGPVEMPTLHSIADKGLRFTNFIPRQSARRRVPRC
jgi:arylsulfatase